jgi:DNA-binding transcriptional MerR regulator
MNSTLDEIRSPGKRHLWLACGVDRGGVGLTVGEAATKVGLSVHTLRWYEREGLVSPVGRDAAGRRRYRPGDLDWLQFLTCLRDTGMPVREMRRYAELARTGPATTAERLRLFEEHRERVLGRIADLQRDLDAINRKIQFYREVACDATPAA